MSGELSVWTPSQGSALDQLDKWVGDPWADREFKLGGLAGTGKTHLAGYFSQEAVRRGIRVEFCAPTGRAASILASKSGLPARTVHSILKYGPAGGSHEEDCFGDTGCTCAASGTFVKREDTDYTRAGQTVIVVDEASMLTSWMYNELMSLGAKVLFIGDYGQLPPVGESDFSIVAENYLDAKLTEVVRQKAGDPITEAAWAIRNGAQWSDLEASGDSVKVVRKSIQEVKIGYEEGRMVLCATNRTRVKRNAEIRARRWGASVARGNAPVVGDEVICLRNDPARSVFNGQVGTVEEVAPHGDPNLGMLRVAMEDGNTYYGPVVRAQFGAEKNLANDWGGLFDFGSCRTVHKSQGSEADNVIVLGEKISWMNEEDQRKWRYTAATRAKKSLTVVSP